MRIELHNLFWKMLLKRLWVSYSLKTKYHNFDINICFRIICQDEENGDEQHEQSWTTFFAFCSQTASTSFGKDSQPLLKDYWQCSQKEELGSQVQC